MDWHKEDLTIKMNGGFAQQRSAMHQFQPDGYRVREKLNASQQPQSLRRGCNNVHDHESYDRREDGVKTGLWKELTMLTRHVDGDEGV